jgi:hypothetical protein
MVTAAAASREGRDRRRRRPGMHPPHGICGICNIDMRFQGVALGAGAAMTPVPALCYGNCMHRAPIEPGRSAVPLATIICLVA